MRAAAKEIGNEINLGAVIVEPKDLKTWYNPVEAYWNEGFFKSAGNLLTFCIHSYYTLLMKILPRNNPEYTRNRNLSYEGVY